MLKREKEANKQLQKERNHILNIRNKNMQYNRTERKEGNAKKIKGEQQTSANTRPGIALCLKFADSSIICV